MDQLGVGSNQILVGGNDAQAFKLGSNNSLLRWRLAHQQIIGADSLRISGKSQAAGGVRLGIAVYKENLHLGGS